jgi:hypothetical protein
MSRVGAPGAEPPPRNPSDLADEGGFDTRRDGKGTALDLGLNLGQQGFSSFAGKERQAVFEASVRRAAGDDDGVAAKPREDKVLAVAEEPRGLPQMPLAAPQLTTAVADPAGPTLVDRAGDVAVRVEQAIRAELSHGLGGPISLKLPIGDLFPGIDAVTITMSADALDIGIQRSGAEISDALLAAAQALADRLQARFSKRIVRVIDVAGPAAAGDAPPADGLTEIARLLRRSDGAS